jgi:putative ABC transport system permease protein
MIMIKSFFINNFRNLRKQRGYVLLNVAGLTIGLTSFLFISLFVLNELGYDRFHKNFENIFRLKLMGQMAGGVLDQALTAAPMAKAMVNDYPEVLQATRVTKMGARLIRYGESSFNEDGVLFADSTFFDVFDFKLVKGDPKTALERPKSIILSESYAGKYFGSKDPMGQRLSFEADTNLYTVTGVVLNVPDNSHMKFDILASLSSFPDQANSQLWISHNFYTYIIVKDGTDINQLQNKFQGMVEKYVGPQLKQILGITTEDFKKDGNDLKYVIEPLKDIHLKGATQNNLEPPGSLTTIYIFAIVAVLILLIAVINYVNLATAKSAGRAKETGVRKVAGASRSGLMAQFLSESLLIVTVSSLFAVLLLFALSHPFNQLIGKEMPINIFSNIKGVIFFAGLIFIVGISAGFYPAFVLASYNPREVLTGTMSPGSMSKKLRRLLVIIQFIISIVIIIGSITVYNQLDFMTKKDIGFEKGNLIIIHRLDAISHQMKSFRDQLLLIPGVEKAGFSSAVPGTPFNYSAFYKDNDPEKSTYLLNQSQVSYDFPQAMGIKLVAGRFFSTEYNTDSTAVLINEAAVKSLGLSDPVGKFILQPIGPQQFQRMEIIGVMKNFNIESMHKAITPVCFTVLNSGGGDKYASVRLIGNNMNETIRSIEKTWRTFSTKQPFQYDFFSDTWNNLYSSEIRTGKIFLIFSILAVFIACLGLIGLVTFITNKRTREIGIRKTYGASNQSVLILLSREVVILIIISSLIAYPVAYFGSVYWLESFAQKVGINPLIYVLATLTGVAIGLLSISYQTIKAVNYNPSKALRTE